MENGDRATSIEVLSDWVRDARSRTLQLVASLDDEQLTVPKLPIVNPTLWEIGHAAWFQERWVVQHAARKNAICADGPQLFDSIALEHDIRWGLPVPSRASMIAYLGKVRDTVLELLHEGPVSDELIYFVKLSVFHEDMHTEALTYTRQTLGYPEPAFDDETSTAATRGTDVDSSRDIEFKGGVGQLGAARDAAFVFDNEKWAHPVQIEPFSMASTAVTAGEFAAFVESGGYRRREVWSEEGWRWREEVAAQHPVYWRRDGGWFRRHFDQWLPLEPALPAIHVNWFEADAYCRWAGRRLPTEAEWELAAAGMQQRRHYAWGDAAPGPAHANLDWRGMGPATTAACAAGDSPDGCRQLIGNVWEWTATTFRPYPGFTPDPYKEYSQPCFNECKVLRGGCWATRSRLIRSTWRNFYTPDRRDVFAGFRTCAV